MVSSCNRKNYKYYFRGVVLGPVPLNRLLVGLGRKVSNE